MKRAMAAEAWATRVLLMFAILIYIGVVEGCVLVVVRKSIDDLI